MAAIEQGQRSGEKNNEAEPSASRQLEEEANAEIDGAKRGHLKNCGARLIVRLPECGVNDGPKMDRPAEEKEPEHAGETKLKDRTKEAALEQLAQSRHKEAAQRRDDVAGGTLA
jgi:hypothetical protein